MTTNSLPGARNARIYVDMVNVSVMDILSGREHKGAAIKLALWLVGLGAVWVPFSHAQL
jgi:hypothetical protein